MAKNYLNKLLIVFLLCLFCIVNPVFADDSLSQLFVKITDATVAVQKGDQNKANQLVGEIKKEFEQIENHDSKAGKEVSKALNMTEVTEEKLTKVSSALLTFDKEQHPVDLDAEKKKLVGKLESKFSDLQTAITDRNLEKIREAYKKMNSTWTVNEGVVRDHSTAHYGKIETAISFLRSAIESEPVDFTAIQSSFGELKTAIDNFVTGKEVANSSSNLTLNDGIHLLKEALDGFIQGNTKQASATMKKFISIWPTIEGDVSTRNPSLYTRVESEAPVIMVKGSEKKYQEQLQALINDLSQIDTSASYHFVDAMLILLREGIEALLIIMALITTLKTSKMKKGLKWVYMGAFTGIFASVAIAILLQYLFPAVASGSNREMIEGVVGIFAVVMMILVGIWLHSKSSVKKWNTFMQSKMATVTATGSFVSMFALSFLAVFREGAETILFYAGIYPRIDKTAFFIGIGLAVFCLILLAFVMDKVSAYFKPHHIFLVLTWLIYILAFKMLGVSIHALQLTNMLSIHLINGFPTIDWAGLYPSLEGLVCQLLFIVVILYITWRNRESKNGA